MTAGILKAQSQIRDRMYGLIRIILHAGCTYHLIAEYFPIIKPAGLKKILKMADQMINYRGLFISAAKILSEGKRVGKPQHQNRNIIVYIRFDVALGKTLIQQTLCKAYFLTISLLMLAGLLGSGSFVRFGFIDGGNGGCTVI